MVLKKLIKAFKSALDYNEVQIGFTYGVLFLALVLTALSSFTKMTLSIKSVIFVALGMLLWEYLGRVAKEML